MAKRKGKRQSPSADRNAAPAESVKAENEELVQEKQEIDTDAKSPVTAPPENVPDETFILREENVKLKKETEVLRGCLNKLRTSASNETVTSKQSEEAEASVASLKRELEEANSRLAAAATETNERVISLEQELEATKRRLTELNKADFAQNKAQSSGSCQSASCMSVAMVASDLQTQLNESMLRVELLTRQLADEQRELGNLREREASSPFRTRSMSRCTDDENPRSPSLLDLSTESVARMQTALRDSEAETENVFHRLAAARKEVEDGKAREALQLEKYEEMCKEVASKAVLIEQLTKKLEDDMRASAERCAQAEQLHTDAVLALEEERRVRLAEVAVLRQDLDAAAEGSRKMKEAQSILEGRLEEMEETRQKEASQWDEYRQQVQLEYKQLHERHEQQLREEKALGDKTTEEMKAQLETVGSDLVQAQSLISEMKEEKVRTAERMAMLQTELDAVNNELEQLCDEADISATADEKDHEVAKVNGTEVKPSAKKSELAEERTQHATRVAEMQAELDAARSELEQNRALVAELKSNEKRLREAVREAEMHMQTDTERAEEKQIRSECELKLFETLESLEAAKDLSSQLQAQLDERTNQLMCLQSEVKKHEANEKSLDGQILELELALKEAKSNEREFARMSGPGESQVDVDDIEQLREDKARLERKLTAAFETINKQKSELSLRNEELDQLDKSARKSRNEAAHFLSELEKAQFELEQVTRTYQEKDEMENAVMSLKRDHANRMQTALDDLSDCKEQLRETEEKCEARQKEIKDLREKMSAWNARFDEVTASREDALRALNGVQQMRLDLEQCRAELEQKNKKLMLAGENSMETNQRLVQLESQLVATVRERDELHHRIASQVDMSPKQRRSAGSDPTDSESDEVRETRLQMDQQASCIPIIVNDDEEDSDHSDSDLSGLIRTGAPVSSFVRLVSRRFKALRYRRTVAPYTRYILAAYFILLHVLLIHCLFT